MENAPKIFTKLAIVVSLLLMLGTFIPAIAYAETPRDRHQDAQEIYQNSSDKIKDAYQTYLDSRDAFMAAKDRFEDTKSKDDSLALKQATKNHLEHSINYIIKQLERLMTRVQVSERNGNAPFTASENIQEYIDNLEDLRDDVATADTREDFQAIINEIRNTWHNVHMEFKYFTLGTVNNKVDTFIDCSESIAEHIQDEIDRLNEAGEDTTKLERLLDDYNDAFDEAIASVKSTL